VSEKVLRYEDIIFQINAGALSAVSSRGGETRVAQVLEKFESHNAQVYVAAYLGGVPNIIPESISAFYVGRTESSFLSGIQTEIVVADVPTLERRFNEQADKWGRETEHLSSPMQIMMHPSYQAILGMARENEQGVIRLMLRDLRDNRRMWFWALSYLTKDNPIKPTDAGKLDKMIKAWVDWGTRRGIL
jgi:hypothetical protein